MSIAIAAARELIKANPLLASHPRVQQMVANNFAGIDDPLGLMKAQLKFRKEQTLRNAAEEQRMLENARVVFGHEHIPAGWDAGSAHH